MNVSFKLNSQGNQLGEHYIRCMIRVNRTEYEFRTGIKCKKVNWKAVCKTYTIKGNPDATNQLKEIQSNLILERNIFEKNKIQFTAKQVYEAWQSSYIKTDIEEVSKNTCHLVIAEFLKEYEKKYKANLILLDSYKRVVSYFNNFKSYLTHEKKDNLLINEIKRGDFENMKLYFFVEKKFKNNHISKMMSCFKGFLDFATDNDYILKNPFNNLSIKKEDTEAIALDIKQVKILEDKEFSTDRLTRIKDFFLLACYTGLSFADTKRLKKTDIEIRDGRPCIDMNRKKTKNFFFVPLLKKAVAILEKYEYNLNLPSNGKFNEYLKEIQTLCEFKENLTTHVARKTFINVMMGENKMSEDEVAKIVGHTSVKTTKKYYIQKETMKKSILKSMEGIE